MYEPDNSLLDLQEPSYPPYPSPQGFGVPPSSQPLGGPTPGDGMHGPHLGFPPMEQPMYPPGPPGGGFGGPPGGGFGPPGGGFGPPGPGYGPPGPGFGSPGPGFGPPGAGFGPPMGGFYPPPPSGGFGPPAFGMPPMMQPYPGGYPNHGMGMAGAPPPMMTPMMVAAVPVYMGDNSGMVHHPSAPGVHLAATHEVIEKKEELEKKEEELEKKEEKLEKKEEKLEKEEEKLEKKEEKHDEHKDEGTIKPHHPFEPKADAEVMKKAMKGFGTKEKLIIDLLTNRSCAQRVEIGREYKAMFGKDLITSLKKELAGDFEDAIIALMKPTARLLAEALHKAKDKVLIEILCTATNKEIHEINEAYHEAFGHPLEKDIESGTSSYLKKLLVSIDMGKRSENHDVSHEKAEKDAELLYKAGEKKWGTDESVFTRILASESYPQLRRVFEEYEKLAKHPFEEALKKEFSGVLLDAMQTIVKCVRNKEAYFAEQIFNNIKGLGTHDRSLIRLIVSRSEIDLKLIKEEYEKKYKKSLHSVISSETSGDYKKVLLGIVKS